MNAPSSTLVSTDAEFARIVDELTRRGFLAGGLGSAALLGLTACGSSGHPDAQSSGSPSTRAVQTAHGTVTVPADPKRIASLDFYANETLWDLGATNVVGVPYYVGGPPRYMAEYPALGKTSNTSGLDLENIAKLNPDLIVSFQYPYIDDAYGKLTAIAPTVVLPLKTWDVNADTLARAVGLGSSMTAFEQKYAERRDQVKAAHRDLLGRYRFDVLHGGADQGKFWLMGQQSVITPVLKDVGVRFASATAGTSTSYKAVSYEDITILADADALIYWSEFGSTTPAQFGPQLFAQRLWKDLPAVKAGRLVPIADFAVGSYGDALAALDELDAQLTALEKNA